MRRSTGLAATGPGAWIALGVILGVCLADPASAQAPAERPTAPEQAEDNGAGGERTADKVRHGLHEVRRADGSVSERVLYIEGRVVWRGGPDEIPPPTLLSRLHPGDPVEATVSKRRLAWRSHIEPLFHSLERRAHRGLSGASISFGSGRGPGSSDSVVSEVFVAQPVGRFDISLRAKMTTLELFDVPSAEDPVTLQLGGSYYRAVGPHRLVVHGAVMAPASLVNRKGARAMGVGSVQRPTDFVHGMAAATAGRVAGSWSIGSEHWAAQASGGLDLAFVEEGASRQRVNPVTHAGAAIGVGHPHVYGGLEASWARVLAGDGNSSALVGISAVAFGAGAYVTTFVGLGPDVLTAQLAVSYAR